MVNMNLSSMIQKTAKAVHDSELLPLPLLAAKARKAAEAMPTDVPLIGASQVLTKMASTHTFITRADFGKLVDTFHSNSTKLSSIFESELDRAKPNGPRLFERSAAENTPIERDYSMVSDPLLANALSDIFTPNSRERMYTADHAKRAERACSAQLLAVGAEPDKVEVFAGRNDIIICQASYNTPKGYAHVLVPVEIESGKALLPDMFLSREGFQTISSENVEEHIYSTAGKSFRVDGEKLLTVLANFKNSTDSDVDAVKYAAIKIAAANGESTAKLDPTHSLYAELENPEKDVQLPQLKMNAEDESIAQRLNKPDGIARFIHGDRVVEAGRSAVVRKLADIGYKSVQVRVADTDEKHVIFAVAIGNSTGITVPVEITGNLASPPKIIVANGAVAAFNKASVDALVKGSQGGDRRALAAASPSYEMKPSELVDVVKKAVAEGNLLRAEEAINVLSEVDPVAYRIALANFMAGITSENESGCAGSLSDMKRIANQPVRDTPNLMSYKIFYPEGA